MGDLIDLFGPGGYTLPPEIAPPSPEAQLIEAMADHGISCSEVILDGQLHRFGKDRTCWYVAFGDGVPAGTFGDWRTGVQETWRADVGREISEEERIAALDRIERAQAARRAAEKERHESAARIASEAWERLAECHEHPYLSTKGVSGLGARLSDDGRLVLPMWSPDGEICSLQFIAPDGTKRFLSGGKVSGCFGFAGKMTGARRVYLAEGFATAATIHQATGAPVFWAYSAGNLPAVAQHVASLGVPMTIVADHDDTGTGQRYASRASELTGAEVVTPPSTGDINDYARAGGDVRTLLGHQTDSWLIPVDEFCSEPSPPRWLIREWLPENCLAMLHGPSGVGKTFFVVDWVMSIASGVDWLGKRTAHAPVVYLAGEGHYGLRARMAAWRQYHGAGTSRAWVSRSGAKLDTMEGHNRVVSALSELPERPALIVVDTLHRFLSGDENSSQDAGKMIQACDRLRDQFGAAVLLVHHTGNSGEAQHRARGSSAWKGALDMECGLTSDNGVLAIKQHKQKDAPEVEGKVHGELHTVVLPWVDDLGENVKSAVWRQSDAPLVVVKDPGVLGEVNRFKRGWFASGAEIQDSAPYVSESALGAFLERNDGIPSRQVKRHLSASQAGLIGNLLQAGVIRAHLHGWIVCNEVIAGQMMVERGG